MTATRARELECSADSRLAIEEMRDGYHFCIEFDYMVTQGEIMHSDDPPICICGFDRRKVEEK